MLGGEKLSRRVLEACWSDVERRRLGGVGLLLNGACWCGLDSRVGNLLG